MPETASVDDAVLETRELAKVVGVAPVLRSVNLELRSGEAALIVGRNGVGKSTLISILAGLKRASSGRAMIYGSDAASLSPEQRAKIGLMAHRSLLYPDLTALENLRFFSALYGLEGNSASAERWLERLGIAAAANQRVRSLSRGMEQRLAVARCLLATPAILLLDEPFTALDSDGTAMVATLIRDAVKGGSTAVVTSHAEVRLEGVRLRTFELARGMLWPLGEHHGSRVRASQEISA